MTSSEEEAFWQQLAAHPDDSHTRLVFADWLEERGDVRAEGMRCLGLIKWVPFVPNNGNPNWTVGNYNVPQSRDRSKIPNDWYNKTTPVTAGRDVPTVVFDEHWWGNESLTELESEVARAFSRLPCERRMQLLQQEVLV